MSLISITRYFIPATLIITGCFNLSHAAEEHTNKVSPYPKVVEKISELMHQYHYNPTELAHPEYQKTELAMAKIANEATNKEEFIQKFNHLWQSGPFSHVLVHPAKNSATALAEQLDNMRVGGQGVNLSWQEKTAILTVNTMMGLDTIEQIDAAYDEIVKQKAGTLIIDLRTNNGGAFAVKPLIEHLIKHPLDVGTFVSQPWNRQSKTPPTFGDVKDKPVWEGWSIRSFWKDVQENSVTRIQMQPATPLFSGPIYVLISQQTASAAELASDALANLPNVTLIGETTAGQMLSQTLYDLPEQMHLFIPVADYYSHRMGRIEGVGVKPSIEVAASEAMEKALALIRKE